MNKTSYRDAPRSVMPSELAAGVRVVTEADQITVAPPAYCPACNSALVAGASVGLEEIENSVVIPRAHFGEAMALVERLLAPPRRRVLENAELDQLYRTFKALGEP